MPTRGLGFDRHCNYRHSMIYFGLEEDAAVCYASLDSLQKRKAFRQ
jgi:hypothetical protein